MIMYYLCRRVADAERLSRDMDHLQQLYDERAHELRTVTSARERLSVQLEEREKNFLSLQQQHERVTALIEDSSRDRSDYKQERDTLQVKFNEKIIETEELRKARDGATRKLKTKEKRVQVRAAICWQISAKYCA